ncbi:MAG TPA: hypothetical protein VKK79_13195 [Candidatus Lokiarchaeia archaeon]|nr:hypothetical protein [Candidatus Lokiarchaeia archaeon]
MGENGDVELNRLNTALASGTPIKLELLRKFLGYDSNQEEDFQVAITAFHEDFDYEVKIGTYSIAFHSPDPATFVAALQKWEILRKTLK